jgi:chalcone isomerase-like protein
MKKAALLSALLLAAPAFAREVAGVSLPDTVTVSGTELRLNGAGIRKKLWIEVYVGALYLPAPSADAAEIVALDAPKRVLMVFRRGVEKKQILDAFREGFEANSPKAELPALEQMLKRIEPALADLKKKDEIVVTYIPDQGTTVTGPAGTATVEGKEFADALFRNWLGRKPADGDLKRKMLGKR